MSIGDVLATVAGVLATGATLAAVFMMIALLFRDATRRAQDALTEQTGRTFGTGLTVALVAGLIGVMLANSPFGLLKLMGFGVLIGLFVLASVGSAGLGMLVAERMGQMDRRMARSKALWRGYLLIVCAGFLPFIGWFAVFPISLIFSLGAGVRSVQEGRRRRVVGAVPVPAGPSVETGA